MEKIRRINLWGVPGSGKSVLAAQIFAALKIDGVNIELVTEYARELAHRRDEIGPYKQTFVTSTQQQRELTFLEGDADLIVTDSPLGLGYIYAVFNKLPDIHSTYGIDTDYDKKYPSINIYIPPRENVDIKGRFHNNQATIENLHDSILEEFKMNKVEVYNHASLEKTLEFIKSKI